MSTDEGAYQGLGGRAVGEANLYATPANSFSQGEEAFRPVKAGAGLLFGFTVRTSRATAQFILLFDTANMALPANGAIPVVPFDIAALSTLMVSYADVGRSFQQGILLVNSTTRTSLTVGSADCWFDVQYQ